MGSLENGSRFDEKGLGLVPSVNNLYDQLTGSNTGVAGLLSGVLGNQIARVEDLLKKTGRVVELNDLLKDPTTNSADPLQTTTLNDVLLILNATNSHKPPEQ